MLLVLENKTMVFTRMTEVFVLSANWQLLLCPRTLGLAEIARLLSLPYSKALMQSVREYALLPLLKMRRDPCGITPGIYREARVWPLIEIQ